MTDESKQEDMFRPPQKGPQLFDIPQGTPLQRCRGCNAPIYWIRTPGRRKPMPVRADQPGCTPPGPGPLDHGRGVSHFIDCPRADSFRRKDRE